jgi:hypothetical protein
MNACDRKNQHRAKTLALNLIIVTIVIIVSAESVLISGIFKKQIRMLTPTTSEIFETNINNEFNSLKHEVQNIEKRIESLSNLPHDTVAVENPKDLVGEFNSKDKKIDDVVLKNSSRGGTISKASRTRSSRALYRKLHRKA